MTGASVRAHLILTDGVAVQSTRIILEGPVPIMPVPLGDGTWSIEFGRGVPDIGVIVETSAQAAAIEVAARRIRKDLARKERCAAAKAERAAANAAAAAEALAVSEQQHHDDLEAALGPVVVSLASCGHPANEDGEHDCQWWPERAPDEAFPAEPEPAGIGALRKPGDWDKIDTLIPAVAVWTAPVSAAARIGFGIGLDVRHADPEADPEVGRTVTAVSPVDGKILVEWPDEPSTWELAADLIPANTTPEVTPATDRLADKSVSVVAEPVRAALKFCTWALKEMDDRQLTAQQTAARQAAVQLAARQLADTTRALLAEIGEAA